MQEKLKNRCYLSFQELQFQGGLSPATHACGYAGLGVCEFSPAHPRTRVLTNNHASNFLFFTAGRRD